MLTMDQNLSCKNRMEKGYTLIQMAIALMVLGVLFAGFLGVYTQYQVEEKVTKTNTRVNNALQSIQKYRNVFGTLPCPAPMDRSRAAAATANPVDNEYGIASNYGRFLPSGAVPLNAGDCAEGICIEQNTRADLGATLRVRVGAIPFRDMQLDEADTYDAYGSRLWYAVTEEMCNLATFNETRGAINIVNDQGETQTTPPNSAAFVVISPGPNRIGGYGLEGVMQVPCATSIDSENCRDVSLATSTITAATYRSQFVQDATLAGSYDDTIEFFSSAKTQLWRRTAPGAEDILDLANNVIGIGETAPSATLDIGQSAISTLVFNPPVTVPPTLPTPGVLYKGEVAPTNTAAPNRQHGALRVGPNTSLLQADVYCNEGGTNCFRPENIRGATGLTCPAGTYPTAITADAVSKNARFVCNPISVNCPPGQTFTGFTNSGGNLVPQCSGASSFASCPATTMTLCSPNDVSLPLTAHDATGNGWILRNAGSCKKQVYRCNNGSWVVPPVSWGWPQGSCANEPITTPPQSCATTSGPCWSGTYTSTTWTCSGPSTDTRATDCLCVACSRNTSTSCSSPLTGIAEVKRYDYICPGPTPQTPGIINPAFPNGTITTPGSCSCPLNPYNTFYDCPSGYIRASGAPALSPNNWPGDINKGKYELVNVSASCTHVGSGTIVDHCSCNLSDTYTTFQPVPATCKEPKSGSRVINGTSYDWKFDVNKVTKNPATCANNAPTLESAAEFQDINTYWREVPGSYTSTVSSKPGGVPEVGQGCNCLANAPLGTSQSTCIKAGAVSGQWDSFKCICNR